MSNALELAMIRFKHCMEESDADDVTLLEQLGQQMRHMHLIYMQHLQKITDKIKNTDYTLEEMCDIGFLCREDADAADEWRKDCASRMDLAGKVLAAIAIRKAVENPEKADDTVRGERAIATVKSEVQPKLPKRGTPEYYALCERLGVSREVIDQGLFKLDFNEARKLVTKCAEEGRLPPEELRDTYPVNGATWRRRQNRR